MKRIPTYTAGMLSLVLVLASLNAQAIMIAGDKGGSVAAKNPNVPLPSRIQGKIESINLGTNTMVVNGISYLFQAFSTKVYSAANAPGVNPLRLKPGMPIQFKTVQEPGSARLRITEIWISGTAGEKK